MAYTEDKEPLDLTSENTISDSDGIVYGDADDANEVAKYITWANLKAQLKTVIEAYSSYFNVSSDTLDDITAGSTNKHFTATDETKLDGIETNATADQTGAEIKAAYEAEADTNAFTDADHSKLDGIEANATADQSDSEIETAYNNQVSQVSAGEKTAGTETAVRRFSPDDVKDMIDTHAPGGGGGGDSWSDAVDSDIIPDADGTRDLGSTGTRFAETYTDALNVTNNIVVGGTVDGRDIATDGTKLDGIEANADQTDTANVTAAGALMDSELTSETHVKALDQSVISGSSPNFTTTNMTDATNKRFMTDAQESVLDATSGTNTGDEAAASTTVAGVVELATGAEAVTGTDTTRAVTPDALTDRMAEPGSIGTTDPCTQFVYDKALGTVNAVGNLGATETFNWDTATHHTGNLDSNITILFSNADSGQTITLYLTYSGAQRTITWPTTTWLDNSSGAAPTAPAASGNILVVTYFYDGTTYYGSATGNYAVYS